MEQFSTESKNIEMKETNLNENCNISNKLFDSNDISSIQMKTR